MWLNVLWFWFRVRTAYVDELWTEMIVMSAPPSFVVYMDSLAQCSLGTDYWCSMGPLTKAHSMMQTGLGVPCVSVRVSVMVVVLQVVLGLQRRSSRRNLRKKLTWKKCNTFFWLHLFCVYIWVTHKKTKQNTGSSSNPCCLYILIGFLAWSLKKEATEIRSILSSDSEWLVSFPGFEGSLFQYG